MRGGNEKGCLKSYLDKKHQGKLLECYKHLQYIKWLYTVINTETLNPKTAL